MIVAAFGAAWLLTAAAPSVEVDRIVAVVNHAVVLESELAPGDAPARAAALEARIGERLLDDEVARLRIAATDAEIDRVVLMTMEANHLEASAFDDALKREGLTRDAYRVDIGRQIGRTKLIEMKVKPRVIVDDATVRVRYEQQRAGEYAVRTRHILIAVASGSNGESEHAAIVRAKARIESGADFADVAREVSDDVATKASGGELGVFKRGEMVREIEDAAFAAQVGAVVGPVRTQLGWHLIRVEERVARQVSIDDVRAEAFAAAVESEVAAYVADLKRSAHIERRL